MANSYQYGSTGSKVKKAQDFLSEQGYKSSDLEGVYGAGTQAAVKQFQSDYGLESTGVFDQATLDKLYAARSGTAQKVTADGSGTTGSIPSTGTTGGAYDGIINDMYGKITSKSPFNYDVNGDALWEIYKDQYTLGGQQAMIDTMGKAAQLTGGYGNSYASTAGTQAYQQYMTGLADKVPELAELAWNRYRDQVALDQDGVGDAYDLAMDMLNSGILPEADTLNRAGLSEIEAQKIYKMIREQQAAKEKKSSGGTGGSKDKGTELKTPTTEMYAQVLEAYNEGGEDAAAAIIYPLYENGYDGNALMDYAKMFGVDPYVYGPPKPTT